MDAKFTPGEWFASGESVYRTKHLSGLIADCDVGSAPKHEREANAKLIAAAPAMYEALILAEDVLARFPFTSEIWPNGTHPNTGIEQIRAAIRAATE